jgi:hypothetical protein
MGYGDKPGGMTAAQEADLAASTAHVTADGSSHTFIDQDVTSGSAPTFTGTNITGVAAAVDTAANLITDPKYRTIGGRLIQLSNGNLSMGITDEFTSALDETFWTVAYSQGGPGAHPDQTITTDATGTTFTDNTTAAGSITLTSPAFTGWHSAISALLYVEFITASNWSSVGLSMIDSKGDDITAQRTYGTDYRVYLTGSHFTSFYAGGRASKGWNGFLLNQLRNQDNGFTAANYYTDSLAIDANVGAPGFGDFTHHGTRKAGQPYDFYRGPVTFAIVVSKSTASPLVVKIRGSNKGLIWPL